MIEHGSFWIQWDRHLGTFRAGLGDDVNSVNGHRAGEYTDPVTLATLYSITLAPDEVEELMNDSLVGQS